MPMIKRALSDLLAYVLDEALDFGQRPSQLLGQVTRRT